MSRRGWHPLPGWSPASPIPVAATPPDQPAMPPSSAAREHLDTTVREIADALAPGGRYACSVTQCDWYADVPAVTTVSALDASGAPTGVTYTGVHRLEVERAVRGHLESHDLEDWILTVHRLRERLVETEQSRQRERFRRERVTVPRPAPMVVPVVGFTGEQVAAWVRWQTELLCEQGAKIVRSYERLINTAAPAASTTRIELLGQLYGIRTAICLARGLDPNRDADKEGPADDLISTWMEQHPEPGDLG